MKARHWFLVTCVSTLWVLVTACQGSFDTCETCGEPPSESEGEDEGQGGQGGEPQVDVVGGAGSMGCESSEVLCGGDCIDPLTSSEFCGAKGDCTGEDEGVACAEGDRCDGAGGCELDCPTGMIDCLGECIDPQSSEFYCGASGACDSEATWGDYCGDAESCVGGSCRSWGERVHHYVQPDSAEWFPYLWESAMNGAGRLMLYWTVANWNESQIFDPETGWGEVEFVGGLNGGLPNLTSLGIDDAGNALVFRVGYHEDGNHARSVYYSAEDASWLGAVDLEEGNEEANTQFSRSFMARDGGAIALWRGVGTTEADPSMVVVLPPGTTVWGTPVPMLASGVTRTAKESIVLYAVDNELRVRRHPDGGDWSTGELVASADEPMQGSQIQADDDGNLVVLWTHAANGLVQFWSSLYRASEGSWTPPAPVSPAGLTLDEYSFEFGVGGVGALLWTQIGNVDGDPVGCATVSVAKGWSETCEAPHTVSTPARLIDLATSEVSTIQAVWTDGDAVRVAAFDSSDETWTDPQTVLETQGADYYEALQIHQDDEGRAMLVRGYFDGSKSRVDYVRFE